ncbi:Cobalamin biosynthesis protein CobD [Desulfamplus magnetovallimortis]|uniref:Cobalamin biosynthesis protein CobD n=1 Tax=Desulfamplus magnetovallimortis TaxID=1246637 RepID=A0A1W1HHA3_9BACT|nr:adenosylcobinamide-phosphate synthase CbiB [Desulfamplus magnetovallimortis]SLM31758.1 Cobalamin biosynthesis protein CobD [Desulfamplus magnetovallimortis]
MMDISYDFSIIIVTACFLDILFGDPRVLPHPVVWMGNAISFFEPRFRKWINGELFSGLLFALFLIFSAWGAAYFVILLFSLIHPVAGGVVQVILMFFCISARTLEKAASEVGDALEKQGVEAGRLKVSMIVGREVKYLDETGVVKATVETVAENFVDGFLSPLFFAIVGGVPMAVAYKMVNTLDSMVGYKNEKYILFGRASAKIDDLANFIPARLSVVFISIAASLLSLPGGARGIRAWKTSIKEGRFHKSPNSGFPEAAFAGALSVKLGGPNYYHGSLVEKPYLGSQFPSPDRGKIRMACDLMLLSSLISLLTCVFMM